MNFPFNYLKKKKKKKKKVKAMRGTKMPVAFKKAIIRLKIKF